jgi:hypothetical protein
VIEAIKISHEGTNNLAISEVCRKTTLEIENKMTRTNDLDDGASYIAIRNNGELPYEIDRLYLMDREESEDKLLIQNITINPGEEYQYIMASDEGLNIKKNGGSVVYLADESGNIIDSVTVPSLAKDESYKMDDNEWRVVSLVDDEDDEIIVPTPVFSIESGFYDKAFRLSISTEDGLKVYYTVDSSNPTQDSILYISPIYIYDKSGEANKYRSIQNVYRTYLEKDPIGQTPVDKCFVVRAVAVDDEGNMSKVVTHSYFIGLDKYKDQKVISLVSDPDGLFGEEGIYVTGKEYDEWYKEVMENTSEGEEIDTTGRPKENYLQRGIEWERLSNLELFDLGNIINNQLVGIRVQGNGSRYGVLKRFSIYSRKEYSGSKWFDTDFFEGIKSHAVVIRSGTINAISQNLASGRAAMNMVEDRIVMFLDGEYWYTSYINEKLSEKYFSEHYGVNENNVIIAYDGTTTTETNTKDTFEYVTKYVKNNDLSNEDNYVELSQMIDIQSYIDYWAINIYLGNMDVSESNNAVVWRTYIKENDKYGDGKWRWVINDMDLSLSDTRAVLENVNTDAEVNSFNVIGRYLTTAIDEGTFWKALTVRDDFCQQFVLSFMDIANTNFSLSNVEEVLEKYGYDISYDDYFFQERPNYIFKYLAEEFSLTGTLETVTLSSNRAGSPITLNTITPELSNENQTWSGTYFTDYPVTVTANADGFDHWVVTSGGSTSTYTDLTIEVPVEEGGVRIYAVFK